MIGYVFAGVVSFFPIVSLPFVVGRGFGVGRVHTLPLDVGWSVSSVMWRAVSYMICGSVRSMMFVVDVGANFSTFDCSAGVWSSGCGLCPSNSDAMSIYICMIAATILVLVMVDGIGSSCSTRRILFRKFSNL